MNLPVIFTLNNPMIAPIMVMVSAFIIGGAFASGVFWLARGRYYDKRVQDYAKTELALVDASLMAYKEQITECEEQIVDYKEQITLLKIKIGHIALHLGKAITHAEIDG